MPGCCWAELLWQRKENVMAYGCKKWLPYAPNWFNHYTNQVPAELCSPCCCTQGQWAFTCNWYSRPYSCDLLKSNCPGVADSPFSALLNAFYKYQIKKFSNKHYPCKRMRSGVGARIVHAKGKEKSEEGLTTQKSQNNNENPDNFDLPNPLPTRTVLMFHFSCGLARHRGVILYKSFIFTTLLFFFLLSRT